MKEGSAHSADVCCLGFDLIVAWDFPPSEPSYEEMALRSTLLKSLSKFIAFIVLIRFNFDIVSLGSIAVIRLWNFFQSSRSITNLRIFFSRPTPTLSYCVKTSYFYHRVFGLKYLTSDKGIETVLLAIYFLETVSRSEVRANPCIFSLLRRSRTSRCLTMSSSTTASVYS